MLFVSDYDVIVEPARTIIILLNIMFVVGCVMLSIMTILLFKKKNPNMKKSYFFGIPLFLLLIGISRGILLYHDFYASDDADLLLWATANLIIIAGFISLNYTIESDVYTKTKHFFTILGTLLFVLYFIMVFVDKFLATFIIYTVIIVQYILLLHGKELGS